MVQSIQHRNATGFILPKQLAVLTLFHTVRHFKPNDSQTCTCSKHKFALEAAETLTYGRDNEDLSSTV